MKRRGKKRNRRSERVCCGRRRGRIKRDRRDWDVGRGYV
jgi:hypothetical protein